MVVRSERSRRPFGRGLGRSGRTNEASWRKLQRLSAGHVLLGRDLRDTLRAIEAGRGTAVSPNTFRVRRVLGVLDQ